MVKAIIAYGKLTPANLVERSAKITVSLKVNTNFPALPIPIAEIEAQTAKVSEAATNAANRDREMLAILRAEKKILVNMLRTTAEYVNTTAAGNEVLLLSSGFAITGVPETGKLPSPINKIDAKFTNLLQSIEVIWSRSKHARYYKVFISADNGVTFTELSTVLSRKLMVENLVSGKRYQFKVVPVGVAGQGEASDIASQIAA